jgi:hypothetical protein
MITTEPQQARPRALPTYKLNLALPVSERRVLLLFGDALLLALVFSLAFFVQSLL